MKIKTKKGLVRYKKNFGAGFTLVELLVVIAIISVLAATVLISLQNQRTRARLSSAEQSVRSAVSIASACMVAGGNVNNPVTIPSDICSLASYNEAWPTLPPNCAYCGLLNNIIYFNCVSSGAITCGTTTAYPRCDLNTTACTLP